jgi:hypothetical protein
MTPNKFKAAADSDARLRSLGKQLNDLKNLKTQSQLLNALEGMTLTKADIETLSAPLIAALQVQVDAEQAVFDGL